MGRRQRRRHHARGGGPLVGKPIEGFCELFWVRSFETIGTSSVQCRRLAGAVNGTGVFARPASYMRWKLIGTG
jgi:molybdopterin biosynthesis enzyme MoaB